MVVEWKMFSTLSWLSVFKGLNRWGKTTLINYSPLIACCVITAIILHFYMRTSQSTLWITLLHRRENRFLKLRMAEVLNTQDKSLSELLIRQLPTITFLQCHMARYSHLETTPDSCLSVADSWNKATQRIKRLSMWSWCSRGDTDL